MTPDRLRGFLQLGIFALLIFTPLPFGSVQPDFVLAIELTAAGLGLLAILLIARDDDARASVPRLPLTICCAVIALGIFQIVPLPFSIAEKFNPTAELVRPLIPYLDIGHPPAVSWSVAPPETTDAVLRLVAYVLIALATAVAFRDASSRRRFAIVLVAVGVFQSIYGSGEYLSGRQHIFGFAKKYYLDSATGTLINRNHFATMLAVTLPFALVLAIPGREPHQRARRASWRDRLIASTHAREFGRILAITASALIWLGLLLSHSRAGLVVAIVGAAIVLVQLRGVRAARWAGAIGGCVLLVLLTIDIAQAPGERFYTLKDEITGKAGRPAVWRDAMALVRARPVLGWGYGTFESAFATVHSADIDLHFDHAHGDWLEWTTEGGVLALGAAIALVVAALRNTRRSVADSRAFPTIFMACQAAIAVLAVHAISDFSLRIPAVATFAATLLGLALPCHPIGRSESDETNIFSANPTARPTSPGF